MKRHTLTIRKFDDSLNFINIRKTIAIRNSIPKEVWFYIFKLANYDDNNISFFIRTKWINIYFYSISKEFFGSVKDITVDYNTTCINELTNLTNLDLGHNEIITDESIKQLTNITNLHLSYNGIITDKSIKQLTYLIHLDLGYNKRVTIVI